MSPGFHTRDPSGQRLRWVIWGFGGTHASKSDQSFLSPYTEAQEDQDAIDNIFF